MEAALGGPCISALFLPSFKNVAPCSEWLRGSLSSEVRVVRWLGQVVLVRVRTLGLRLAGGLQRVRRLAGAVRRLAVEHRVGWEAGTGCRRKGGTCFYRNHNFSSRSTKSTAAVYFWIIKSRHQPTSQQQQLYHLHFRLQLF